MKPGGELLNPGDSYKTDDGKQELKCVQGSDGKVTLEYTDFKNVTQLINFCVYEGKNIPENGTIEVAGATFICTKKGDKFEFDWQKGGECKLNNSVVAFNNTINVTEKDGDVTYQCLANSYKIELIVKGKIFDINFKQTYSHFCSFRMLGQRNHG